MVASTQEEIPYFRAVGRQRGRGFGSLAQIIGRTAIPLLRKYIVPAAKSVGADLLDFAVPEIAEVVSGRKNFKTATKSLRKQTLKKQLGEGKGTAGGREPGREARKGLEAGSFQQNLLNNPVGREETFLQKFLVDHLRQQFPAPTFCGMSGNLGGKVPIVDDVLSSHEQEINATTSLDENCIEFEF